MVTRNVVLTEAQDAFVKALVESGRFQNASEAMRAGLRLLEREEAAAQALIDRIAVSLAQAGRGELVKGDPEDIIRRAFDRGIARARNAG